MSLTNKSLFGIPVEIDEAATAQWYSKQESWDVSVPSAATS